ncbi:MAG: LacI family DNA-binding transcriptional regulator, partial [Eubacteriales bacterium]|nr:LacI family DNA-binding transcriptional regulator [Eubacteriales bacterium]
MAATMKDIAKMTGLGLATISKFFNGGTVRPKNKKLIEEAVKELHFVPNEFARSLKTRQSRTVGVVIPELGNQFITSIITTMEDILRKHDYAVIVCDCRTEAKREREAVSFLVHKRVDGLINMPTDTTGEHLRPALDAGIPIVLVDRMLKPLAGKVSAVVVDNVDAAEKATRFLLESGHTEIGLILGNEGIFTTQKRREGYLNAYEEFNIQPRQELIRFS